MKEIESEKVVVEPSRIPGSFQIFIVFFRGINEVIRILNKITKDMIGTYAFDGTCLIGVKNNEKKYE